MTLLILSSVTWAADPAIQELYKRYNLYPLLTNDIYQANLAIVNLQMDIYNYVSIISNMDATENCEIDYWKSRAGRNLVKGILAGSGGYFLVRVGIFIFRTLNSSK